jgi:hypothetical protein
MNRAEYDAWKDSYPPDQQWQFWPPPLRLATWKEIPGIFLYWLAGAAAVVVGFLLLMWLLASMMDAAGERCRGSTTAVMKRAHNGDMKCERCRMNRDDAKVFLHAGIFALCLVLAAASLCRRRPSQTACGRHLCRRPRQGRGVRQGLRLRMGESCRASRRRK